MKKILIYFSFILFTGSIVNAQKHTRIPANVADTARQKTNILKKGQLPDLTLSFISAIQVFEHPNYQGRSAYFTKKPDGKLDIPFPLTNVSFKVADGMIVYIKRCFEFPTEEAFTVSQPSISLANICGIRSDEAIEISVAFNGISTEIHNDDCKRFFGYVKVEVLETSPDMDSMRTLMPVRALSVMRGDDKFTFQPFHCPNVNTWSIYYMNHVFNNDPVPELSATLHSFGRNPVDAIGYFKVGKTALEQGRIKLAIGVNLASAHKSCNTCDDFSSNVKMSAPVYELIPLNRGFGAGRRVDATNNRIVLGPYLAKGSRDGFAITASAGTVKHFRVHLTVMGL